jgi:hypothetical protein
MCEAWKTPVYYHSGREGLGTHLLNTYLEIVDIYGLYILAFVFTTTIVYNRNTICNNFTSLVDHPVTYFNPNKTSSSFRTASSNLSLLKNNNSNDFSELRVITYTKSLLNK